MRMIFISITDIAQIRKNKESSTMDDSWPGMLVGKGVSEIAAAYMIMGMLYLIWRIESTINAYLVHGGK